MKDNKKAFVLVESVLAAILIILVARMFWERSWEDRYRVSVIIEDSDSSRWSAFRYGLKMAAEDLEVELSIVSTGISLTEEEEKELIESAIGNGAKAVIVQPVPGEGTEEMLTKVAKRVPVMLTGCAASGGGVSQLPVTGPDNYAVGVALAEGVLEDYSGNIDGTIIGILAQDTDAEDVADREKGIRDTLEGMGVIFRRPASSPFAEDEEESLRALPKVDIVVALDDRSLVAAGKCSATDDLHGALVYGIGSSTEAVYYLDTDAVRCLVVPDGFQMGYQSLTEIAQSLGHYFHKTQGQEVSYTVLRKETLFSEENQDILFTMSQ